MRTRSVLSWLDESRLALPFVLLLAALVRLYRLDALSFWLDEAATLQFARGAPWDIWGSDTHPPLYYALISAWRLLGESEYLLRLSSVLFSLGSVWAVHAAGVALGGRRTAFLAGLLLALSPFSVQYAQELRSYALLECSGALALLGLVRLMADPAAAAGPLTSHSRWSWALYPLGSILVLYSHNMGFIWPLVANLAVLLAWWRRPERRRLARRWGLANALVLLAWMLYWPALLSQLNRVVGGFWIWQPGPAELLGELGYLAMGLGPRFDAVEWGLGLLFLALALFGLWRVRPRGLALALLLLWGLPPLVEYALVLVARPLFLSKTIIWSALPFVLLLGQGLAGLPAAAARAGKAGALAALALVVAVLAVRGVMLDNQMARWSKADWRGLTRMISEQSLPGDRLLVTPRFEQDSLDYYAGRLAAAGLPALPPHHGVGKLEAEAGIAAVLAELAPEGRLWVVRSLRYGQVLDPLPLLAAARPCLLPRQRLEAVGLEAYLLGPCD